MARQQGLEHLTHEISDAAHKVGDALHHVSDTVGEAIEREFLKAKYLAQALVLESYANTVRRAVNNFNEGAQENVNACGVHASSWFGHQKDVYIEHQAQLTTKSRKANETGSTLIQKLETLAADLRGKAKNIA
ncbi:hypothetical protein M1E11_08660 [Bacillus sp. JZ8]